MVVGVVVEGGVPCRQVAFDVEAVVEEVLGHETAGNGLFLGGEDVVGAGEEGGEQGEDVDEAVEGGFGVVFEGGGEPFWAGEEGGCAVEEGGADLLMERVSWFSEVRGSGMKRTALCR